MPFAEGGKRGGQHGGYRRGSRNQFSNHFASRKAATLVKYFILQQFHEQRVGRYVNMPQGTFNVAKAVPKKTVKPGLVYLINSRLASRAQRGTNKPLSSVTN